MPTKNKNENTINEALRYIENSKTILSEKAVKVDKYYSDAKYVRMACNNAWNGVLLALNFRMKKENITFPTKNRMNVDIYRDYLRKKNIKILNDFNSAYNYLHLLGGYDGDLRIETSKIGIDLAKNIINWCKLV